MINLKKYISPRNKYLIKNDYHIINTNRNQFHLVIYYIEDNKIEIIVRKLNQNNGWNHDLKIKILSLSSNDNYVISIGSSDENSKIVEMYTQFNVEKKELKNLNYIPKKIIQTNKKICDNIFHFNSVVSLIEQNPDYEYLFFDDNDSREFIKNNFFKHVNEKTKISKNEVTDILKAYDLIIPGAIRADLFRYAYLYINGGVYLDSKISITSSLDNVIDENDKYLIVNDDAPKSLYNGILIFEKNNQELLNMIKELIYNVLNKNYLNDIHEPTGNKLFYKFFNNYEKKFQKHRSIVKFQNNVIFNCEYVNYYKNYYNFRDEYFKNNFYFKKNIYIQQYVFSFYNNKKNNYEFKIFLLKENIFFIKRMDSDSGWDDNIYLRIYDPINKKHKEEVIEKNIDNEFVFSVE